jgi:hypothetical protein
METTGESYEWDNDRCFLPDNEIVHYHSIIIFEVINFEDFNDFIDSLDRIYVDLNVLESRQIDEFKKNLLDQAYSLYNRWQANLPFISDKRIKDKLIPMGVFHDISPNIDFLEITIYGTSMSAITLKIQADLNPNVTDKINDIIYRNHDPLIETHETPKGKYISRIHPAQVKTKDVENLRVSIKMELINFLKEYFKGNFFNHIIEESVDIIPSIDLLSLNYPINEANLLKWLNENIGFLNCFNTSIINPYKSDNYLLFEEVDKNYNNYLVFSNRNSFDITLYDNIDSSIKNIIKNCSFELFAIYRLTEIHLKIIGKFNLQTSNEIIDLEKENSLDKIIQNRKNIYPEIFNFERFKIEFGLYYVYNILKCEFISIRKKDSLSKILYTNIKHNIDITNDILESFGKHSNNVLNIKNVEYTKRSQDIIKILTFVIILMALLQVILIIIHL